MGESIREDYGMLPKIIGKYVSYACYFSCAMVLGACFARWRCALASCTRYKVIVFYFELLCWSKLFDTTSYNWLYYISFDLSVLVNFCAYYYSNCLYKNDLYFTVTGLVCSAFLKKLSKKANNIKEQILSIELEEHSKYTIF